MNNSRFLARPEKRNYLRLDVSVGVDLIIEGKKIQATATNISCGGLFLSVRKSEIKQLTDIEILMNLPSEEKPIKVIGEVARVQERSYFKQRPEGVAIRFQGLYNDSILAIDRFIKDKMH